MWIASLKLGIRHLALYASAALILIYFVSKISTVLLVVLTTLLVTIIIYVFHEIISGGVFFRQALFYLKGERYEVLDRIFPLHPGNSYRELLHVKTGFILSKIFLNNPRKWAYFDDMREALSRIRLPQDNRTLILGGGGNAMGYQIKSLMPRSNIDVVEKVPQIIKVARQYFLYKDNSGINLIHDDAVHFVVNNRKHYDLIFVDVFDGNIFPYSLSSNKFIYCLKKSLSASGILIVNYGANNDSKIDVCVERYKKVFPVFKILKCQRNIMAANIEQRSILKYLGTTIV